MYFSVSAGAERKHQALARSPICAIAREVRTLARVQDACPYTLQLCLRHAFAIFAAPLRLSIGGEHVGWDLAPSLLQQLRECRAAREPRVVRTPRDVLCLATRRASRAGIGRLLSACLCVLPRHSRRRSLFHQQLHRPHGRPSRPLATIRRSARRRCRENLKNS